MPKRSAASGVSALLGVLLAAPLLGVGLAALVAPDSTAAEFASFVAFPLALFLGMMAWLGLGFAAAILSALGALLRGRLPEAPADAVARVAVPPGHGAFVVCSVVLATLAGIVAGVASPVSLAVAVAIYGGAGLAYGWVLHALARDGYLPFPEPE